MPGMDIEISVMVIGVVAWFSSSIQALVDSTPLPSTSAWRKKSSIPQRMCGVIDPDHHKPAATHISTTQLDTANGNCLRGATPNCCHKSAEVTRRNHISWRLVTTPPMISWVAAVITVLAAAVPLSPGRLDRFVALTGLEVTGTNARQVIDHFAGLRRWRLATVVLAAPVAGLTADPFYLVLGWCAVPVFRVVRSSAADAVYRRAWVLAVCASAITGCYLLMVQGITPTRLAHAAIVVVVVTAISYAVRNPGPEIPDETESAIRRWSVRTRYLAGSATVLAGVLLAPWQAPPSEQPQYAMPRQFPAQQVSFQKIGEVERPTCPWIDEMDAPCRYWRVDGAPFPQAAPYVVMKGGAPTAAPFLVSPDRRSVVYLDRTSRRLVHQHAGTRHDLSGPLADADVPEVSVSERGRYVALAKNGTRVIDTRSRSEIVLPGALKVLEVNSAGVVATTASRLVAHDHRGKELLSIAIPSSLLESRTAFLKPDGSRLVVISDDGNLVETYDLTTRERIHRVRPRLPDGDPIESGTGWSGKGPFQVHRDVTEEERGDFFLDLATGKTRYVKNGLPDGYRPADQ
ncbi:hypothetical protein ABZ917_04395 [Nonomuraea wenchangensis]